MQRKIHVYTQARNLLRVRALISRNWSSQSTSDVGPQRENGWNPSLYFSRCTSPLEDFIQFSRVCFFLTQALHEFPHGDSSNSFPYDPITERGRYDGQDPVEQVR